MEFKDTFQMVTQENKFRQKPLRKHLPTFNPPDIQEKTLIGSKSQNFETKTILEGS